MVLDVAVRLIINLSRTSCILSIFYFSSSSDRPLRRASILSIFFPILRQTLPIIQDISRSYSHYGYSITPTITTISINDLLYSVAEQLYTYSRFSQYQGFILSRCSSLDANFPTILSRSSVTTRHCSFLQSEISIGVSAVSNFVLQNSSTQIQLRVKLQP